MPATVDAVIAMSGEPTLDGHHPLRRERRRRAADHDPHPQEDDRPALGRADRITCARSAATT